VPSFDWVRLSPRTAYSITFGEAPGLAPGTPVRKSGVRIGEVQSIDLDPATGQVRVGILVESKYLPRKNEEPTIARGFLTGDTSLDFVPKSNAEGQPISTMGEVIPPNSEITGVTPINPNTFVKQASGVLPSAQESMVRILNSMQRVEAAMPKIEKAFEEIAGLARSGREFVPELRRTNDKIQSLIAFDDARPDDQEGLRATLKEVREFSRTAKPLIDNLNKLIKDNETDVTATVKAIRKTSEGVSDLLNDDNRKAINSLIKNLTAASTDLDKTVKQVALAMDGADALVKNIHARVTQAGKLFDTTEKTMKSAQSTFESAAGAVKNVEAATKPLADNADAILKNVNIAADQLSRTLVEVRSLLASVNRGEGTVQKALNDPALFNNLNEAAFALTQTLKRAEKVAQDLQVFSDKIARRPELIGVGGALRPSSGLKDAPAANCAPVLPPSPLDVPTLKPMEPIAPTRNLDLPGK
jgi:phospholipid/cholesterol/gamma-HCH transport system substrate-binding protein